VFYLLTYLLTYLLISLCLGETLLEEAGGNNDAQLIMNKAPKIVENPIYRNEAVRIKINIERQIT